jgi:arginine N-succinyltransferase
MKIIRPIQQSDFAELCDIAVESGIGFTSLPVNDDLLRQKITDSESAFTQDVKEPGDQSYLFVMQDTETGEVVGTSGIEAALGINEPNYHYHLGKVVHASRELKVYNPVEILTLCNDYTGVSEICTLFLREPAREGRNGRLLSKFRFLFLAEHSHRFADRIIAEMRGVSSEDGTSPFWQWLQDHFFSLDFPTADYLTGIGQKVFIAELMPKYPIYVNLLSEAAQKAIGKVHDKTKPALQLLESEGFSCQGYVDIFDAGPTVEANLQHIRTVNSSRKMPITIGNVESEGAEECFIINTKISDFRAICAQVIVEDTQQKLIVSSETANALKIVEGDDVRFAPSSFKG